jgi:hypothetical protein
VTVKLEHYGVDRKEVVQAWKQVANHSERQFGAFVFLSLLDRKRAIDFKTPFNLQKYTEFRNKVIHQGFIPTRDQVVQFAESVLRFLQPLLEEIRTEDETATLMVIARDLTSSAGNDIPGERQTQISYFSTLSPLRRDARPLTLQEALAYLQDTLNQMKRVAITSAEKLQQQ